MNVTRYLAFSALLLIGAISLTRAGTPAATDPPAVGTPAPDFTLTSNEGKQISLKDFRGQWIVLYFYPRDFTGGCTLEAHNFQRDSTKYAQLGAVILGVSVDSVDSHKGFCAREGLSFRLLSDPDASVSAEYGSLSERNGGKWSARNTFIIDPQGRVARVFVHVSPDTHSDEVIGALVSLQGH